MLEELDKINWSEYSHAYGFANDVPNLLLALTHKPVNEADKTVENALDSLYSNIWHQGTVYPATAIAVPFLIEILNKDLTVDKYSVLGLLLSCGTGYGYLEVHGHADFYHDQRKTADFQNTIKKELQTVHAAHNAVVAGLPVYSRLLHDDDPEVRLGAAYVLSICKTDDNAAITALKQRISIEQALPDADLIIPGLIASLGAVLTQATFRDKQTNLSPEDANLFTEWVADKSYPPGGRIVASSYLLKYGRESDKTIAIDFISSIPKSASKLWRKHISTILRTLQDYDLNFLMDWLTQMATFEDQETLKNLLDSFRWTYENYRVEKQSLINFLDKMMHHDNHHIREETALKLSEFSLYAIDLKNLLDDALMQETNEQVRRTYNAALRKFDKLSDSSLPETKPIAKLLSFLADNVPKDLSLDEILTQIDDLLHSSKHVNSQVANLFVALEAYGATALNDNRTMPLLKEAITQNDQWVRVKVAHAMAVIAPEQSKNVVVPVLIEELRGRPVGVLAMNALKILAQENIDVSGAIPRLKVLATSHLRQIEIGAIGRAPFEDEEIKEVARSTLEIIENKES